MFNGPDDFLVALLYIADSIPDSPANIMGQPPGEFLKTNSQAAKEVVDVAYQLDILIPHWVKYRMVHIGKHMLHEPEKQYHSEKHTATG